MTATPKTPTRLMQLLAEKKQYLLQFLDITTAQTALIESEDMDALAENLELRAQIIAKVDGLRPELAKLLAVPGGADGASIVDLQQQISRILKEISEIDHKNHLAARERMDYFQAEIRRAGETRKGVGAYLMSAEVFSSEYFDERQ